MANRADRRPEHDERGGWSAREIARRNLKSLGKPLSPVMKTAATARELAHGQSAKRGHDK